MLDIEPRNRPTAAQVCLDSWMKNSNPIVSHPQSKLSSSKVVSENSNEKLTPADVKVSYDLFSLVQ